MSSVYIEKEIKTIDKTYSGNQSGFLSFFEGGIDLPFDIKRVYYISGVKKGGVRGFHAHKELKQFLFCPYGSIELTLEDENNRVVVLLNSINKGILIDHIVWREMKWLEDDSILFVAASDYYSEDDYIRSYEDFKKLVRRKH